MRIRKRRPTVFKLPDLNLAPGTHAGEDDDADSALLSHPSDLAPGTHAGEDDDADPALLSHPSDLAASLCQQVLAPNGPSHRARRVDVSHANSPKVSPLQPTIFITTTAAARVSEIATAPPLTLVKEEMGQTLISSQRELHENSFPSTLVAWDRFVNVQDYTHKPSARIRELGLSTADHMNQGHRQINSEDDYHCTNLEEDQLHSTDGQHHHQSAFDAFNIELGQLEAIQQLANTERSTSGRRVLCFEYSQRLQHCFSASDRNAKGMEQFVSHASGRPDDAKEGLMITAVQQSAQYPPMMQLDMSTCTPRGGHQNVGISQKLQCGRADGKELQQQRCGRTDGKEWQCKNMRAVGGRTIYCAYHQEKARENHAKNLHKQQHDLWTRGHTRKERKTAAAVLPSSTLVMNVISPEHTSQQQLINKTKRKKRSLHEILTQQAEHVAVEEVLEGIHKDLCCHIQPAR